MVEEEETAPYSIAELIAQMHARGIGRPSTYASSIDNLERNDYIEVRDGKIFLTERGRFIAGWLKQNAEPCGDPDFTVQLEKHLDEIEQGSRDIDSVVHEYLDGLSRPSEPCRMPDETPLTGTWRN